MTSSYLLIDFGNTYIKAGIYDVQHHRIIKTVQIDKTISPKEIVVLFNDFKKYNIAKVIEVTSANPQYIEPFNRELIKLLNVSLKIVTSSDFKKDVDISKIKPHVVIGNDILTATYYIIKTMKTGAVFALGTAYFCVVSKEKQLTCCYLLPSISNALQQVSSLTTIPHDYLPKKFNTIVGNDTPSCFAAGATLAIEGLIEKIIQVNKIKPEKMIITGGDAFRFPLILKKYKEVKNLVLEGLAILVKEKNW